MEINFFNFPKQTLVKNKLTKKSFLEGLGDNNNAKKEFNKRIDKVIPNSIILCEESLPIQANEDLKQINVIFFKLKCKTINSSFVSNINTLFKKVSKQSFIFIFINNDNKYKIVVPGKYLNFKESSIEIKNLLITEWITYQGATKHLNYNSIDSHDLILLNNLIYKRCFWYFFLLKKEKYKKINENDIVALYQKYLLDKKINKLITKRNASKFSSEKEECNKQILLIKKDKNYNV